MRTLLFLSFLCFGLGCTKQDNDPIPYNCPVPDLDAQALAKAGTRLGWQLFQAERRQQPNKNILLSPWSIQTNWQTAMCGAQGATLDEMGRLLLYESCDLAPLHQAHQSLKRLLEGEPDKATLTSINGFFYDSKRIAVEPAFLQTILGAYQCEAQNLSFDNEDAALATINQWGQHGTKDKIKQVLDNITPLDVAFAINALHFQSDWEIGFGKDTFSDFFTPTSGIKVPVTYLSSTRFTSFAQTHKYWMVDLPFKGGAYTLNLIMPSSQNTDLDWVSKLDADHWEILCDSLVYKPAVFSFPRMDISYKNDLISSFRALGATSPFSPQTADFGIMYKGKRPISISQISHHAVLRVDEKGAEGASTTTTGWVNLSLPRNHFHFTTPFVLVVRHQATNLPLFIGYVEEPRR